MNSELPDTTQRIFDFFGPSAPVNVISNSRPGLSSTVISRIVPSVAFLEAANLLMPSSNVFGSTLARFSVT